MAIQININPNYVNIITDALLIVLSMIWAGLVESLTKLDIKQTLRLGRRIFSYEVLGSRGYLRFGLSKYRKLREEHSLTSEEVRSFRWKIFRAAFFFSLGICIVFIHLIIDFGLGFDTTPQMGATTAPYSMAEIRPDAEGGDDDGSRRLIGYLTKLRNIENPSFSDDSTDAAAEDPCQGITVAQCQRDSELLAQFYRESAREQINFARTTFETPGLKKLDVIQELFAEAKFAAKPGSGVKDKACNKEILSLEDMDDYDGAFQLRNKTLQENCELKSTSIVSITFDLRASRILRSASFIEGPSNGGRLGLNKIDYVSWRDSKDERQGDTLYNVANQEEKEFDGVIPRRKLVTISSRPGIQYADNSNQTVSFKALTLSMSGKNADPVMGFGEMFNVALTDQEQQDFQLADNCLYSNTQDIPQNVSLIIEGVECGTFSANFLMAACRQERTITIDGEEYQHGEQLASGIIAIPGWTDGVSEDQKTCRDLLTKRYAQHLPTDRLDSALFAGFISIDVTCLTHAVMGKFCTGGRPSIKWDSATKTFVAYPEAKEANDGEFKPKVDANWAMIAINDQSGKKTHKQALTEIGNLLMSLYPLYQKFASFGWMSRNRILGMQMHKILPLLMGAMSSQLIEVERELFINTDVQIAVLDNLYIYGVLSLLISLVLLAIYTFVRFITEYVAYKRLNLRVSVPMTATEWIAVALGQVGDSQYREPGNLFVSNRNLNFDAGLAEENAEAEEFENPPSEDLPRA